jgi:hypothetical protein
LLRGGRLKAGNGGEGGIRTPGTRKGTSDFESGAFNRALPPLQTWWANSSLSAKTRQRNASMPLCHIYIGNVSAARDPPATCELAEVCLRPVRPNLRLQRKGVVQSTLLMGNQGTSPMKYNTNLSSRLTRSRPSAILESRAVSRLHVPGSLRLDFGGRYVGASGIPIVDTPGANPRITPLSRPWALFMECVLPANARPPALIKASFFLRAVAVRHVAFTHHELYDFLHATRRPLKTADPGSNSK